MYLRGLGRRGALRSSEATPHCLLISPPASGGGGLTLGASRILEIPLFCSWRTVNILLHSLGNVLRLLFSAPASPRSRSAADFGCNSLGQ